MPKQKLLSALIATGLALSLASCGGGGGNIASNATGSTSSSNTNSSGSTSSAPAVPLAEKFFTQTATSDTGGDFDTPIAIAVDGAGNIWNSNFNGGSINVMTKSSDYSESFGSIGMSQIGATKSIPRGMAFDPSGNLWIVGNELLRGANCCAENLYEFQPASSYSTAININPGYSFQRDFDLGNNVKINGVAIDQKGNVWLTEFDGVGSNGAIIEIPSSAIDSSTATSATVDSSAIIVDQSTVTGLFGPISIAIDHNDNVWVADYYGNDIIELPNSAISAPGATASTIAAAAITIAAPGATMNSQTQGEFNPSNLFNAPLGIAIDQAGDVWVTNLGNNSVTELPASAINASNATGASISASSVNILGGATGFDGPCGVAVDGGGNIWIVNNHGAGSVTELLKSDSYQSSGAINYPIALPQSVLNTGGFSAPTFIAIDQSGNVWVTDSLVAVGAGGEYTYVPVSNGTDGNFGGTGASGGITELPGVAVPVITLPILPGEA